MRCVETGSIYPSAEIASHFVEWGIAGQIRKVCRGDSEIAGGYKWEYVDISVLEATKISHQAGLNVQILEKTLVSGNSKPVRCKETNRLFVSATEAERATKIKHIHSVCSGSRASAGGYTWEYVDMTTEQIFAQASTEIVDVAPVAPSNAKCPIEAVDPDTGEILGVYPSINEAQRATGATNINRVLKGEQPLAGKRFWRRR